MAFAKHYGDELLREVMRQADVIIAVVSASRLYMDPSWRTIPELIFKGPNLLPSAVILTQSDVAPTGEDAVQYRKRQVSEAFWPDDGGGPILECSVRLGASAHALLDILESSVSKPSFEELWNGDAHGVWQSILLTNRRKSDCIYYRRPSRCSTTLKVLPNGSTIGSLEKIFYPIRKNFANEMDLIVLFNLSPPMCYQMADDELSSMKSQASRSICDDYWSSWSEFII